MKRALKIIVPILLIFAVLFSIGWYFIKYDPDLTRDMLVAQARILDDQGNHKLATWFYNLAYQHSGNDEAIALELAEQYRSMGNYTKAEYTLSNAIADGGSLELYIALCNTYVEQDKLLDAVTMLDNVADPNIKKQLDSLRPQAPVPNQEPGYYNQYITVSFTVPEGEMCITTDGSYPSRDHSSYVSLITLPAGESVIHSLTIGQNGLVSPLSVVQYTITGVIEEVVIEDPAIDRELRNQLKVNDDHVFYTNELWNVTALTVPYNAKSLSDLSKLPFLQRLTLQGQEFDDMTVLSELEQLEQLFITDTSVSDDDLKAIAALPKLKVLTLSKCNLSGISPLSSATELTQLDLGGNTIGDLSALEHMPQLTFLNLSHNAIADLSPLSKLNKLEYLDLSFNSITDASALVSCTELAALNLSGNAMTVIEGLDQLTKLQILSVSFNKLTELDAGNLSPSIVELDISNNSISDISSLSTMDALVALNISYNQVKKLPSFSKDCALVTIKASNNQLTSVKELSGLKNLQYVIADFNEDLNSVSPLLDCYALVQLSVYGTKVRDVSELIKMGVSVRYTPI